MSEDRPFVSVIVPARNERRHIRGCLDSLLAQDYPAEQLEILFVDGVSIDGTREIAADYARQHPRLRLLDNPRHIVPAALNVGLREARGEIVVRVDGHCVLDPDYVSQCVGRLLSSGAMNVGGPMRAVGEGYWAEGIALATSSPFGVGNARFHYSDREELVDTVYLGAFQRRVFDLVGEFDEELVRNQDDELNYRIRASGGKILLSPAIKSRYFCRNSLSALFRQYYQYGYWKVRVGQKHPRSLLPRHYAPPAFALVIAVTAGGAALSRPIRRMLAMVVGTYAFASALMALRAAGRRPRLAPAIALAFGCLHFGYGTGFLVGLLRTLSRKRWLGPKDGESKGA